MKRDDFEFCQAILTNDLSFVPMDDPRFEPGSIDYLPANLHQGECAAGSSSRHLLQAAMPEEGQKESPPASPATAYSPRLSP